MILTEIKEYVDAFLRSGGFEQPIDNEYLQVSLLQQSPDWIHAEKDELSLSELTALQTRMLWNLSKELSSQELGEIQYSRIIRDAEREHPIIPYNEALRFLQNIGDTIPFGSALSLKDQMLLTTYWGSRPVVITHFPWGLKPFWAKECLQNSLLTECSEYILPYAGTAFYGFVNENDHAIIYRKSQNSEFNQHIFSLIKGVSASDLNLDMQLQLQFLVEQAISRYLKYLDSHKKQQVTLSINLRALKSYLLGFALS